MKAVKFLTPVSSALLVGIGLFGSAVALAEDCQPTHFTPEDLSLYVSCAEYKGVRYQATLKSDIRQAKHGWNLSTIANGACWTQEQNCVIIGDDLRLVLSDISNFDLNKDGRQNLHPEENGHKNTLVLEFKPDVLGEVRWGYVNHHRSVANKKINAMGAIPQWFRDDMTEREVDVELANHGINQ